MPPSSKRGPDQKRRPDQKRPVKAASRQPERRPVRRPNDELPLPLGGRLWAVFGLLIVMVAFPFTPLGKMLDPREEVPAEHPPWEVGKSAKVRITVITGDYPQLQCASDAVLAGKHCEYKTQTERFPTPPDAPIDDNKRDILQPYRTAPDNMLLLIGGFWAEPQVAMRLHSEPATIANEKLARFIVECDMNFVGTIENPTIRWNSTAQWGVEKIRAMVAVPKPNSCRVFGPDEDS
jgi:hypothetical protein